MFRSYSSGSLLLVCLTCTAAQCQMVVHAVSGTVTSIDPKGQHMSVAVDGQSDYNFTVASGKAVPLSFDPELRREAVDANQFRKAGDYVVVYYYGVDAELTAVAVKDIGKNGVEKTTGTVAGFDKHKRELTVKGNDGSTQEFRLSDTGVIDTGMGLESGRRYDPQRGTRVRVTAVDNGGEKTAMFVWSRVG